MDPIPITYHTSVEQSNPYAHNVTTGVVTATPTTLKSDTNDPRRWTHARTTLAAAGVEPHFHDLVLGSISPIVDKIVPDQLPDVPPYSPHVFMDVVVERYHVTEIIDPEQQRLHETLANGSGDDISLEIEATCMDYARRHDHPTNIDNVGVDADISAVVMSSERENVTEIVDHPESVQRYLREIEAMDADMSVAAVTSELEDVTEIVDPVLLQVTQQQQTSPNNNNNNNYNNNNVEYWNEFQAWDMDPAMCMDAVMSGSVVTSELEGVTEIVDHPEPLLREIEAMYMDADMSGAVVISEQEFVTEIVDNPVLLQVSSQQQQQQQQTSPNNNNNNNNVEYWNEVQGWDIEFPPDLMTDEGDDDDFELGYIDDVNVNNNIPRSAESISTNLDEYDDDVLLGVLDRLSYAMATHVDDDDNNVQVDDGVVDADDEEEYEDLPVDYDFDNDYGIVDEVDEEQYKRAVQRLEKVVDDEKVDKKDCGICFDELRPNDDEYVVCRLSCKHMFHDYCIIRWFKSKLSCPLCRSDCGSSASC